MSNEQDTPSGPTGPSSNFEGGRPSGRVVFGLAVLGLGVVFLLHQFGVATTDRWWTVIFLVLAGGALVAAARFYRAAAGWTAPAVGALTGGLLLLGIWAKLFFGGVWHGPVGSHAVATHAAMWHHGPFAGGHILLPIIVIAVVFAVLARRRWQR